MTMAQGGAATAGSRFRERFPVIPYDPEMESEPTPWLMEKLWMRGKINGVFGPEKSGKSRLLGWLLVSLLTGRANRLGVQPRGARGRWLYLAGEEMIEDVVARLMHYGKELGMADGEVLPIDFVEAAGMRLDTKVERDALEKMLLEGEYEGLVIEPLRRVHGGKEDSNDEMARLNNAMRHWSNRHGITIVFVHHTGKLNEFADTNRIATWSRGCSDLAAIVDTACFIEEASREKGSRRIRLLRAGRFPPVDPTIILDSRDPQEGGDGFQKVG